LPKSPIFFGVRAKIQLFAQNWLKPILVFYIRGCVAF